MQKFLRTLMLAALMLVPFASQAQTLTVCDGTVNSEYVPFDGYNADAAQHNQMLYPATDLTAMNGQAIMQMVFYIDQSASNGSNTAASRLGTWTVSLGETTATTLSSLDNTTTLTQVYQGYFDCSTGTLTLEFDQAYLYNGGNLLVDLNHAAASWNRWYFLGVTTTADASYNGYDEESYTFLPKCTFTYGAAPSCFKVSNLTASNATTSSLTLTWTDALNTNATYSIYDMSDTTLLMANVTGTTCVVNSLSPATTYTLGVQTNCGSDNADGYTVVTGTTACEAITTFPWSEDFEDMTGSSSGVTLAEPCWLNEHISGSGTYFFEVYSSTSGMGGNSTKMLRLHDMSNGTQTKLRLPAMDFQGNYQFVVDVYRNASGTSYTSEGVRVFASTDGEIAGATELGFLYRNYTQTDGGVVTAESASGWYTYEFNIPITNGTGYIILRGESSYGAATYMDNFIVREAPSCLAVTGLAVSAATNNSLTLTWTDALNTGATYSVYTITPSDTTLVEAGISTTTYTVTGLTANTVYVFGVVANCSATDASSAMTVTGRTECDATQALPYAEEFNGYTGFPSFPYTGPAISVSCWDYYSNGTNTAATTGSSYYGGVFQYSSVSSTYACMTANNPYLCMPIYLCGSAVTSSTNLGYQTARGTTKVAVLPALDAALNTLQISFDYRMSSTYSATGAATVLELGYVTGDTSTFVSIWNHNSTTTTQHVTELNLSTLAAAAPAGARLAFKFHGTHNGTSTTSYSTYYCGIDNILVEALPSCLRISDLAVSETSSNSISLTWNDTLNTGATYSVYTITPSDTTLVEAGISTTTYTVTGLTANTAYVFGVVANCSATDASVMTVVSGRTACTTITVDDVTPYIENFDSYTVTVTSSTAPSSYPNHEQPGCWSFLNMSATSSTYPQAFMTNYSSYADSANCLFFKSSNTTPLYAILPEFDATGALQLQFSYRNEGVSAYNGTIIVGVMSNAADATTFVALDTMAQTTTITSVEKIIPASVLVNGARIAFCYLGGSSNNYYAAIDNVIVSEAPACVPVVALTADSITAHEALLTWIGEASSYNVYDMSDTTLITTVYDTVVNLTNLTADASHTIGVASVCGSEESDTMTVTFRTLVSCPVPTGLAVTLTPGDGTVADINWVEAGEATEWEICLNNDMANTIVTYDTFYNFTSLTAEQAYTVKVRAICGIDDTSAWTAEVNFTPTNAYSITVADSTATNGYVPVYGLYADSYLRSQIVYPAADLAAMTYGAINSLTFYSTNANVNWGSANFKVYLTETTDATISSFTAATSMTNVYEGALSISGNQMVVTFTTPYTYMGGNLLVAVDNTAEGDYVSCTWLGINSNGSSVQGYNYSSLDGVTPTQRDFIPKTTFAYIPGTAPACLPVTGLTAVNVTADSATLTWNSTAAGSYTVIDMSDSSYVASVTDTFYVLTGLTAMTSYTYGVAANCSSDDSDTIPVSFATACGIVTLPYTEGFEANSGTRNCWTTDGPGSWSFAAGDYSTSTGAFEGSVNAKINHSSNGNVTKLISPVLDLNGATGVQLTYAHIQRAWAGDIDELRVYYRTSATDTWTVVAAYTNEVATWTVDQVMLPATTYQVAFEMTDGYGYGVAVDSVVFTPLSANYCYPVTNVTVESATATSVTISWADTANVGNFSVYNGTAYVGTTTDTFYTFTGLTATTDYTFGVRALCSATDSSSLETVAGRTDCVGGSCNITIASGNYGFLLASIDVIQNGDTLATVTDGFTQAPYTQSVNVCSGVPVTLVYNASPYSYDNYVSFTVSDGGNTVVYTCADASTLTDGAVFTTIASACPSCMPAQNLTVDSADPTSVSISWSGNAASYDVYNGTTFVATVTTNNYTFTGLTASTSYTFGVQAICSATDSASMATINATTACADVTTLPYMEGFENGLGCWSTVNGSADGQPWTANDCAGLSSITPHSGLYVASSWSWSGSAMHADAWLISPKFVLPTVAAGDTLNFNWWHITNGGYPDSYSVVLSTTTNDTNAFTTVIRPYGTADSTWTMQSIDLTAYAGQSVYIAFHHVDYDNNYLLIDEISLALGAAPVPDPDTMTVTFAVNDATMGTTNPAPGTYQYLSGDTVRFEAIATTGHVFTGWNLTVGTQSFTSPSISVYFDVNTMLRYGNTVTVTANFEPGTPDSTTITYAVNDPTLGTTNPAPGTYTIYVGDSINASATAYTGSVLAAWVMDIIVDSAVYSSDTLYSDDPEFTNPWYVGRLPQNFIDAGASIVITAIFEDEDPGTTYYTVTGVANDPAMGYVLGSNRYAAGSEVVLTAVANNGYRFVRWSNGETTATITFTATENVELTAFFEVDNTGIEDANMANVSIYSTDNKIVVRGAEGQSIYVFDLNGRVMARENNAAESVEFRMQTTGVYLVKVGTAAAKRVVLMR
ncbi:MAG: choice-of-anchor J domain-containing protein [Bacteroidales bacterium]|nr:choice-of-anchor J domain-containing protein [Bacteroidales bacterium]